MLDRLKAERDWTAEDFASLEPPTAVPRSSRGDEANVGMTETFGPHRPDPTLTTRLSTPRRTNQLTTGLTVSSGSEGLA